MHSPLIYEPFGIVSLEVMAMEKPVVVGAQGVVGFKEQVVNGGPDEQTGNTSTVKIPLT